MLSSTITSSQFTAQLQLSNATTWVDSGSLDIESSDAGIIWAFGTNAPSDPSDPTSDFEQHRSQGTFSIDMKSAQVAQQSTTSSSASPTDPSGTTGIPAGNGTTGNDTPTNATPTYVFPSAPTITGDSTPDDAGLGLSYQDKVLSLPGQIVDS